MRPQDVGRTLARRIRIASRLLLPDGTIAFDELPTAAAVRIAYNTVLLREPDPAGADNWQTLIRRETRTKREVLLELRGSDEAYFSVRLTDLLASLHRSRCDFVRTFPRAGRILDLGGTHQSSRDGAFVRLGYPYRFERLVLVDLPHEDRHDIYRQSERAEVVDTRLGPVEYRYHSMTDLSLYDDSSFDLVYSGQTIEHVSPEDCDTALAEVARVLRPGGWFCVDTPNHTVCRLHMAEWINDDHQIEYTHEQLTAKLEAAGLQVVEAKGLNYLGHPAADGGFDLAEVAGNCGIYGEPRDCYLLAYIARKPG